MDENYHKLLGSKAIVLAKPTSTATPTHGDAARRSSTGPYEVVVPPEEHFMLLFDPAAKRHFYYNTVAKRATYRRPKEMHVGFGDRKQAGLGAELPPGGTVYCWLSCCLSHGLSRLCSFSGETHQFFVCVRGALRPFLISWSLFHVHGCVVRFRTPALPSGKLVPAAM